MSNKAIFARAAELTEKHALAKGWYAKDKLGNRTREYSDDVCAMCTVGFIFRAAYDIHGVENYFEAVKGPIADVIHKLDLVNNEGISYGTVGIWNDKRERSIDDVRKLFQELAS